MTSTELCTRVHVKPAPERQVRMPDRNFDLMPDEGLEVTRNTYWARRIAVGDVIEAPPAGEAAAAEPVSPNPATQPIKGAKAK